MHLDVITSCVLPNRIDKKVPFVRSFHLEYVPYRDQAATETVAVRLQLESPSKIITVLSNVYAWLNKLQTTAREGNG